MDVIDPDKSDLKALVKRAMKNQRPWLFGRIQTPQSIVTDDADALEIETDAAIRGVANRLKGGKGSGHFSHIGRPGKRGGSQPGTRHGDVDSARFADFIRGTVVRINGHPLVVFHGSYKKITAFTDRFIASNTGAATAGLGFFFTDDPRVANQFGTGVIDDGSQTVAVCLAIRNPIVFEIDDKNPDHRWMDSFGLLKRAILADENELKRGRDRTDEEELTPAMGVAYRRKLINLGYDGIVVKHTAMDAYYGGNTFYIAFRPDQIWVFDTDQDFYYDGPVSPWALQDVTIKGGPGSGNFGHAGRPGEVGGSAPQGGMAAGIDPELRKRIEGIVVFRGKPPSEYDRESAIKAICEAVGRQTALGFDPLKGIETISVSETNADFERDCFSRLWESLPESARSDKEHIDKMRLMMPNVVAEYEDASRTVYLRPIVDGKSYSSGGEYTALLEDTMLHECGHAVYHTAIKRSYWDSAFRYKKGFDRLTTYSRRSASEAFAESYSAFIESGGKVNSRLPSKAGATFDMLYRAVFDRERPA